MFFHLFLSVILKYYLEYAVSCHFEVETIFINYVGD